MLVHAPESDLQRAVDGLAVEQAVAAVDQGLHGVLQVPGREAEAQAQQRIAQAVHGPARLQQLLHVPRLRFSTESDSLWLCLCFHDIYAFSVSDR